MKDVIIRELPKPQDIIISESNYTKSMDDGSEEAKVYVAAVLQPAVTK